MKGFQHEWCKKILEKLDKKPTSGPFKQPVATDINPRYNEIVKQPMNLAQVQLSLKSYKYQTVMEFASDVRLIWYNAMIYYQTDDPKYLIAADLSKWFENKLQNYPQTINEKWMMKFKKLHTRIKNLIENPIPMVPETAFEPPVVNRPPPPPPADKPQPEKEKAPATNP